MPDPVKKTDVIVSLLATLEKKRTWKGDNCVADLCRAAGLWGTKTDTLKLLAERGYVTLDWSNDDPTAKGRHVIKIEYIGDRAPVQPELPVATASTANVDQLLKFMANVNGELIAIRRMLEELTS